MATQQYEELLRALNVADAGSVLLQPEIDKIIAQLVDYQNPLRQNLDRKKGSGAQWILNRRAAGATAGEYVADTDSLTEDTGTYTQVSFTYRTLATRGRITRKLQATGASFGQILADEISAKAEDYRNREDYAFLWGQNPGGSPVTGPGGVNEFDGLNKQCQAGGTTVATSGSLTAELLDQSIDSLRAPTERLMFVASRKGRRKINAVLQGQQRFNDTVEVRGGFKVASYNGVPIFTSTNIPDDLTYNGSDITNITGGTTTALYLVDRTKLWIGELTPVKIQPLAKTDSQFDQFDIYSDHCLVVRDPQALVRVIGIA